MIDLGIRLSEIAKRVPSMLQRHIRWHTFIAAVLHVLLRSSKRQARNQALSSALLHQRAIVGERHKHISQPILIDHLPQPTRPLRKGSARKRTRLIGSTRERDLYRRIP